MRWTRNLIMAALGILCVAPDTARGDGPEGRRVGLPIRISKAASEDGVASGSQEATSARFPLPLSPPSHPASVSPPASRSAAHSPAKTAATVLGSLAMVLGLFFLVVAVTRRAAPKGAASLPVEAVELLGRRALTGRNQLHLVRFGNKLVLLSVTAAGAEPVAEITEALEVDRIAGLCLQRQPGSMTATFRQLISQMGRERTSNTFIGRDDDHALDDDPELPRGLEAA